MGHGQHQAVSSMMPARYSCLLPLPDDLPVCLLCCAFCMAGCLQLLHAEMASALSAGDWSSFSSVMRGESCLM